MLKRLYRKLFMYGITPKPFQKILGFFLGKPIYIKYEEMMLREADGFRRGLLDTLDPDVVAKIPEYLRGENA